jgi:hypothetical protein
MDITGFKKTFIIDLCRFHHKGHVEALMAKFHEQKIVTRAEMDFALGQMYKIEDFVFKYIDKGYAENKLIDIKFDWSYLPVYTKEASFIFRDDILDINLVK